LIFKERKANENQPLVLNKVRQLSQLSKRRAKCGSTQKKKQPSNLEYEKEDVERAKRFFSANLPFLKR
jgi:hypothetical protein